MKTTTYSFPWRHVIIFFIILSIIGNLSNLNIVRAAKIDKIAPTVPTNLHVTAKNHSSVTLAWTRSKDNIAVKRYYLYQNKKLIGNSVSNNFNISSLKANTSYSFSIKAQDVNGNMSPSSQILKVITAKQPKDNPPHVESIQISPIGSDGQSVKGMVTLSVRASDDKGIKKVSFYSFNGGQLIQTVTSPPFIVNWDTGSSVPNGKQVIKAVVYDTSNQSVRTSKNVLIKNSIEQDKYKMVGYYTSWSTYSNYQISTIDVSKLTHLNYAFANISPEGKIILGDPWADVNKPFPGDATNQSYNGNFHQLKKLKEKFPHLKTLISVGGWTWSERFSDVALTERSRTIFANSLVEFILKYDFDGVDLDWEYPVSGGEQDNINRKEDKQNFTLLIKKINEAFTAQSKKDGKKYLLTIAGGTSPNYVSNTELNLLHQYVDYIQLMSYDFHGSWDTLTGLNAPLYQDPDSGFLYDWSVQDAVQTYIKKGVPTNKIIVGIPFYGRVYNQVTWTKNGLYQPFSGGGSAITYNQLQANFINKNGFIRYWESDSKVPWLFNGSQMISYDDVESIGYKAAYIKSMGLGGAMMWELSQDSNQVLLSKLQHDLNP